LSEFESSEAVRQSEEQSSPEDTRAIAAELLSAVMSLIPDAAVVADPEGRIVSVNEHAEDLFGYLPGSLAGLSIETLIPERVRRRHHDHRAAYVADPQSRPMGAGLELTGRRRDGSEFPIDISLAPITNDGERLVVAAIRDITDQRRAAAAQAELATIVRSSSDAIISTTLDGRITNWNPAAEELFGFRSDEILGEHIVVLVPSHASPILEISSAPPRRAGTERHLTPGGAVGTAERSTFRCRSRRSGLETEPSEDSRRLSATTPSARAPRTSCVGCSQKKSASNASTPCRPRSGWSCCRAHRSTSH